MHEEMVQSRGCHLNSRRFQQTCHWASNHILVHVEAIQDSRDYPALAYTVTQGEEVRDLAVSLDISVLHSVHKQKKMNKNYGQPYLQPLWQNQEDWWWTNVRIDRGTYGNTKGRMGVNIHRKGSNSVERVDCGRKGSNRVVSLAPTLRAVFAGFTSDWKSLSAFTFLVGFTTYKIRENVTCLSKWEVKVNPN